MYVFVANDRSEIALATVGHKGYTAHIVATAFGGALVQCNACQEFASSQLKFVFFGRVYRKRGFLWRLIDGTVDDFSRSILKGLPIDLTEVSLNISMQSVESTRKTWDRRPDVKVTKISFLSFGKPNE